MSAVSDQLMERLSRKDLTRYEGKWVALDSEGNVEASDSKEELKKEFDGREFIITRVPEENKTMLL